MTTLAEDRRIWQNNMAFRLGVCESKICGCMYNIKPDIMKYIEDNVRSIEHLIENSERNS